MNIDLLICVESETNRINGNSRVSYSLGTEIKGVYRKKSYDLNIIDCNCNRAVLEAICDALTKFKGSGHVLTIKCPSWYVVNSIHSGLIVSWVKKEYINARGKTAAHADLWSKITPMLIEKCGRCVKTEYVKNEVLRGIYK